MKCALADGESLFPQQAPVYSAQLHPPFTDALIIHSDPAEGPVSAGIGVNIELHVLKQPIVEIPAMLHDGVS